MADETNLVMSPILDQLAVLQKPAREEKKALARKLAEERLALYYLEHKFPDAVERFEKKSGHIVIPDKEFPSILKRAKRYYGLRAWGIAILGGLCGLSIFGDIYLVNTISLLFVPLGFVLAILVPVCGMFSNRFFYILRNGEELPPIGCV